MVPITVPPVGGKMFVPVFLPITSQEFKNVKPLRSTYCIRSLGRSKANVSVDPSCYVAAAFRSCES